MPDKGCLGKEELVLDHRQKAQSLLVGLLCQQEHEAEGGVASSQEAGSKESSCSACFPCPVREPSLESLQRIFSLTQPRKSLSHAQKLVSMAILKH